MVASVRVILTALARAQKLFPSLNAGAAAGVARLLSPGTPNSVRMNPLPYSYLLMHLSP
jgi:hypothetical protein